MLKTSLVFLIKLG